MCLRTCVCVACLCVWLFITASQHGSDDWELQGTKEASTADVARSAGIEMKGSGLPSIKPRTFGGQRKEYREWKRETQSLQFLYQVPEARMATLVYVALEPRPGCDTGLGKVCSILDEEYVLPDYRRSDEAQLQYDKCHRAFNSLSQTT
eukprot:510436-Amphidinium_carterae.1